MENIENNKIRIDPDIFRLLLQRIRDAKNPEEIKVKVQDEEGATIVYNNGRVHIIYNDFYTQIVVAEKVRQAVAAVINEALL